MLRAVLFDFNGVLVDDEPIQARVVEQVLLEEDVHWDRSLYEEQFVGVPDREVLQWALEESGRTADVPYLMRLLARKRAYYQEVIRRDGYPWFAGVIDLVRSLAEAQVALGIVSGSQPDEISAALDRAQLGDCFKVIVSADDVERGKPDPEGFIKGLIALNTIAPLPERLLHPHEVLAIEDSQVGLEAARKAGLSTLAVTSSFAAERLATSDRIVERLAGLSVDQLLLRPP